MIKELREDIADSSKRITRLSERCSELERRLSLHVYCSGISVPSAQYEEYRSMDERGRIQLHDLLNMILKQIGCVLEVEHKETTITIKQERQK